VVCSLLDDGDGDGEWRVSGGRVGWCDVVFFLDPFCPC